MMQDGDVNLCIAPSDLKSCDEGSGLSNTQCHPATQLPSYPARYGIPPENVANSNFIETATVPAGTPFVTRPAPPSPDGKNAGGGIEVVVPSGAARMTSFSSL